MLKGSPASPGIGIGAAHIIRTQALHPQRFPVADVEAELARFTRAVDRFCETVEQSAQQVAAHMSESEAGILMAQVVLVRDPDLQKQVTDRIRTGENAEYALSETCLTYVALFSAMDDELLAARAADFEDIRNQMLAILTGSSQLDLSSLPRDTVLVAVDLSPSQAAAIKPGAVAAIVTEAGTRYSHIAILARALRIPAAVSVPGALSLIRDGDIVVVDGGTGEVLPATDEERLTHYRTLRENDERRRAQLERYRSRETRTRDGRRVELAANLAIMPELPDILSAGADGIGLFRTEFLYMDAPEIPDEQTQFEAYKAIAAGMRDKPVIVRTLDIGGDKPIPYLGLEREENPFLGYRAVRFCLDRPDIFLPQLRALLRASAFGNVHIMVPMITTADELRQVKQLLEQAKTQLRAEGRPFSEIVPLGAMIETPAAALIADKLAQQCSFFSLGTNDLTQYTLAVDRGNRHIQDLYSCLHPSVLTLIHHVIEAANRAGIPVGICGEAAADPLLIPFLVGCGITELSVSTADLLAVRAQICELSYADWQRHIPKLLALSTADEAEAYLRRHI